MSFGNPVSRKRWENLLETWLKQPHGALEERRDWVNDIVDEAMEDIALARAIEEGLGGESVSRDEVFALLESSK